MSLQKTRRVLRAFALVLLIAMAVAYIPARAAGTESSPAPPGATGTTTIRVTVQPTVITSFEMVPDGNGPGSCTPLVTGNTDCRTDLLPATGDSSSSPQVMHFLTYL